MSEILGKEINSCGVCYQEKECLRFRWRPLIWNLSLEKYEDVQFICEDCLKIAQQCDFCQKFWKTANLRSVIAQDWKTTQFIELMICPDCYFGEAILDPYIRRKMKKESE